MRAEDTAAWEPKQLLFALGLCAKARALVTGTPMICDSLSTQKKPHVVVAAADNAANTQKKLSDKCAFYGVTLVTVPITGEALAHAVGKTGHLAAVGVTDPQLASLVKKNLP